MHFDNLLPGNVPRRSHRSRVDEKIGVETKLAKERERDGEIRDMSIIKGNSQLRGLGTNTRLPPDFAHGCYPIAPGQNSLHLMDELGIHNPELPLPGWDRSDFR